MEKYALFALLDVKNATSLLGSWIVTEKFILALRETVEWSPRSVI